MIKVPRISIAVLAALLIHVSDMRAVDSPIGQRVANTTLNLPLSPPQFGYSLADAFPGVRFTQPLCIVAPPGETNRLFVLEKGGNITVITNLASPTRTIFLRLTVTTSADDGLLGLAFHPGYATNRYFYVFSTRSLNTSQGNGRHMRLSR